MGKPFWSTACCRGGLRRCFLEGAVVSILGDAAGAEAGTETPGVTGGTSTGGMMGVTGLGAGSGWVVKTAGGWTVFGDEDGVARWRRAATTVAVSRAKPPTMSKAFGRLLRAAKDKGLRTSDIRMEGSAALCDDVSSMTAAASEGLAHPVPVVTLRAAAASG